MSRLKRQGRLATAAWSRRYRIYIWKSSCDDASTINWASLASWLAARTVHRLRMCYAKIDLRKSIRLKTMVQYLSKFRIVQVVSVTLFCCWLRDWRSRRKRCASLALALRTRFFDGALWNRTILPYVCLLPYLPIILLSLCSTEQWSFSPLCTREERRRKAFAKRIDSNTRLLTSQYSVGIHLCHLFQPSSLQAIYQRRISIERSTLLAINSYSVFWWAHTS